MNKIKTLEFSYIVKHKRRYCGMLRYLSVSWIIFVLVVYVGVVLNFQSGKSFAVRWRRQTKFLFFFANFRRVLLMLQGSSGNNSKVGRWKIWRRGGGIRLSSFLQISPKVSAGFCCNLRFLACIAYLALNLTASRLSCQLLLPLMHLPFRLQPRRICSQYADTCYRYYKQCHSRIHSQKLLFGLSLFRTMTTDENMYDRN